MAVRSLADPRLRDSWLMVIDLKLEAANGPVTLGKTPFGLIGVRMARTIGINDGGGLIRNSEGNVNEQGPNGCFWKRARWVDYSGPITPVAVEGITLFDHPREPQLPVPLPRPSRRLDGREPDLRRPADDPSGQPLRLRYGLLIHPGAPEADWIDARWKEFADLPVESIPEK